MSPSLSQTISEASLEFSELRRLLHSDNKQLRRLVFYSEGGYYLRYLIDYIDFVLANSDLDVCYITSDPFDPIFSKRNERIKPFFIRNLLSAAFARLDAKAIVMTAPDLNQCAIRRAPSPAKHIYAFHGVSSTHQSYRKGAFDHYDSVLCLNALQAKELSASEQLYNSRKKELVLAGYPFLERLNREHQVHRECPRSKDRPLCLIAPTWSPLMQDATIMDTCLIELLQALSKTSYRIWLRPHNEYMRRNSKKMDILKSALERFPNVHLQSDVNSIDVIHKADFLITDHSSIAYDFALGTERPVLYINTRVRRDNPECDKLTIEPFENLYREKIGHCLDLGHLNEAADALVALKTEEDVFRQTLIHVRSELIANWQNAATIGGSCILESCR